MNSLNHYSYGAIVEWMYRHMGGINPVENAPGFAEILWAPKPDYRMSLARVKCSTPVGVYESGWRIEGKKLHFTLTVPFGGRASAVLPHAPVGSVTCNGAPIERMELEAGTYEISYVPTVPYVREDAVPDQIPEMIMDT